MSTSATAGDQHSTTADEQWFRTLFTASPDPAWIIEDHHFVECNDAAVRTLGYGSKDEFLNAHPSQLSPSHQPDGEDSFSKAERMMGIAQESGLHRFEWVHLRADGSHFIAEVTLSDVIYRGRKVIYCVWRDITERRETEARLRLASSIMESTSEGVLVTDERGTIISVNPAFTQITGYSAEEAIGNKPNLLRSDHHGPAFYEELWQSLLTEGRWEGEIWNRHKNGTAYPQLLTINRIPARDGMPTCYASVFRDITALHQANERFQYLAFHDALTGLPNRALFHDRLAHAIERSRRDSLQLAVIFIDLDGFKEVNDSLGHDMGDLLLREIAQRIRSQVRRATDTVARLGGDEFLVLMEDLKGPNHCEDLAAEIIDAISLPLELRDKVVSVGASLGLARFPEDSVDAAELLKYADIAMYAAKAAGKNRFSRFRPAMLSGI
jgi:diguanylate cyclase (GGDEF)-like protein/PAS domain S-box-containing protein